MLYLPFIVQGIVMLADEFYFHEKRGLPTWEKWGHPLDTLTVLSCFAFLIWGSFSLNIYIGLCLFSCLFITKDEFIHTQKCTGIENWLHSLLFILHPLSFLAAYLLWQGNDILILKIQFSIMMILLFYQIIRWSIPWRTQMR